MALVLAAAACSPADDESASTAQGTTSTAGTTTTARPPDVLDPCGCPIRDEAFCSVATDAANALAARDRSRPLELSRPDTINCAEVAREYFPGCRSEEVLGGYGLSGPDLLVELVTDDVYADHLDAITSNVDPSFSDVHGNG
jgi:hypothetical protein